MPGKDWILCLIQYFIPAIWALIPWIQWKLRSKLKAKGGDLLLEASRPRVRAWNRIVFIIMGAFVLLFWGIVAISPSVDSLRPAINTTLIFGAMALSWYWGFPASALELRVHGILVGPNFSPWEQIQSFQWEGETAMLKLKISHYGYTRTLISPEQKEVVDKILEQHVSRSPVAAH
jgi:hypothetical protein